MEERYFVIETDHLGTVGDSRGSTALETIELLRDYPHEDVTIIRGVIVKPVIERFQVES